jgi:hypothetical protein
VVEAVVVAVAVAEEEAEAVVAVEDAEDKWNEL